MSTRSAIIERLPDGTYRGIYCHFDGYEEGVGHKLRDHYQDPAKVSRLLDLGNISALYERVEPVGSHSYDCPEKGTTIAYHRDRGEEHRIATGATVADVESQIGHNDCVYVFENGRWTFNGSPIEPVLVQETVASTGPGTCTGCGYPNEYQTGPYLCSACRL